MPPPHFPLRWESTGDQWWYASPIDWAAANGHYDLVWELLHLDANLLIKLTSLRRIRRLETVWDDEAQFKDVAKCRSQVARKLLMECETKTGHNSLIRAGYGGWLLYTAASAGEVGFVRELLGRDPFLVFGEGEYGVTDILYGAARSKSSEVFRLLLESSMSLRCSHSNGEELKGQTEDISSVYRWEIMNRAIHAAARGGNTEILRELLRNCSDVLAYRDAQGSTVLHTASGRGQVEVVKDLLASYDIINSKDNRGNTALNIAAYKGYLAVVELLVSASPSSTPLTNNYGDTFLHMAAAGFGTPGFRRLDRQIELMKHLVSGRSINVEDIVNVRNHDGRTALHMAVIHSVQTDLVELLMTMPAINLNIRDTKGMTPLDLLKQRPRSVSSELLIKQLISAGGISRVKNLTARNGMASHLKMQGVKGSPGTLFKVPDAEIFLYTGIGNAPEAISHPASRAHSTSISELNSLEYAAGSNSFDYRRPSSISNAAKGLQDLLPWLGRKERKSGCSKSGDDESLESYKKCGKVEVNPTPLRLRFSRVSSLPNNKRIVFLRNNLPSPSTKQKFAAGLMQGVIRAMPETSGPLLGSSGSSPASIDKQKGVGIGDEIAGPSSSNNSLSGEKSQTNLPRTSFNKKAMNQCLCFGTRDIAVEDSVSHTRPRQSHTDSG